MIPSPEFLALLRLLACVTVEVALIVGIAEAISRTTSSASWRRIIWQSCLASLAIFFLVESSGITGELAARARHAFDSAGRRSAPVSSAIASFETLRIQSPLRGLAPRERDIGMGGVASISVTNPETLGILPAPSSGGRPARPRPVVAPTPGPALDLAVTGLILVWLAVGIWLLGRTLAARLVCSSMLWSGRGESPARWIEPVNTLSRALGIGRRVRLIESARLGGPVAFGVCRPTVGIPLGLAGKFSRVQFEAMLAHELAHLAGCDPLWYLLSDLLASVFWWHPLLWFARRRLRDSSERAADEASLLIFNGPQALAECLLTLARQRAGHPGLGAPGIGGNGFRSSLAQRVERLCQIRDDSWRPPGPVRAALVRTTGSCVLAAAVALGAGWTNSPSTNQRESMKTIRSFWTESMSALVLLIAADPGAAASPASPVAEPAPMPAATDRSSLSLMKDATLLFELGKYDEAARKYREVIEAGPENRQAVEYRLGIIREMQLAQANVAPRRTGAENAIPPAAGSGSPPRGMDSRLAERYGLVPKAGTATGIAPGSDRNSSESIRLIQSRLDQIAFDEVQFQAQPLSDVLRFLNLESRQRDPMKTGVNFLINPNAPPEPNSAVAIDPTTGQPVPLARSEAVDLSGVLVNFTLPLRNVRLADVLNAVVKVADKPIQFSVEEYGVVFSRSTGPVPAAGATASNARPDSTLGVRTFKVDTNTFLAGLESAFGISVANPSSLNGAAERSARSRDLQAALRKLLQQLGVRMDDPAKAIFYNDLTGVLMVRATSDDLDLVEAAVKTLGGGATVGAEARVNPNPHMMDETLMRRYGLLPRSSSGE